MSTLRYKFSLVLMVVAVGVPATRAQDQAPQTQNPANQPIPGYRSPLASVADNGQDSQPVTQDLAPDTRSLTGAQDLSLGAPKTGHSYWQPYVDTYATVASNPPNPTSSAGWSTWTSLSGGIALHRTSGNSDLVLTYLGGASISNEGNNSNGIVQQMQLLDKFTFRRYVIIVADQVAYLPEAAFGYSGLGSLISSSGGNVGLQVGFSPNQSILTSEGQRLTNVAIGEVDTVLTARSSLTFVGSYGLLRYFDNDLQDSTEAVLQAGYNYQLTRQDTIAFFYHFDGFRYTNANQSINDHSFGLSYARRVTGRLAFQIAGGPSIAFSNIPITGSSTSSVGTISSGTPTNTTQIFWNLYTTATYRLQRVSLGASYNHGVTGGSGVLAGSVTDDVSGSASRDLTRNLTASWAIGYSRNTGIALPTSSTPIVTGSAQTYDYLFSNVYLTRTWGRSMRLNLGYQVQYQTSNTTFCITVPCSTSYVSNLISFGLGWHPGPKAF